MRVQAIACSMMEDEIRLAMERVGCPWPVEYLERRLHERPERLREELQSRMERHEGADVIVLALAQCGNAPVGLQSQSARLVLPRFPDCVHLLRAGLGETAANVLHFTRGWVDSPGFLGNEYQKSLGRYGEETTRDIFKEMLHHYRAIGLINTGAYDLNACFYKVAPVAELLGLRLEREEGTLRILEKLFSGRWDEDFIVTEPGEAVTLESFHEKGA